MGRLVHTGLGSSSLVAHPLVLTLADFTDDEFVEVYVPYLRQRHDRGILTPPLPKGSKKKLFLDRQGVRY